MEYPSSELQRWLDRMKAGDPSARDRILECAEVRLRDLAWKMLRSFPGVQCWDDVDEVFQQAAQKLWDVRKQVAPGSVRELLVLAGTQIRRMLIDLARHYHVRQDTGSPHDTPLPESSAPRDPADTSHEHRKVAAWTAFHEHIEALPEKEREVFELHWYHGLTHVEAGDLLEVPLDTVRRRWQSARLRLYQALGGELPEV